LPASAVRRSASVGELLASERIRAPPAAIALRMSPSAILNASSVVPLPLWSGVVERSGS